MMGDNDKKYGFKKVSIKDNVLNVFHEKCPDDITYSQLLEELLNDEDYVKECILRIRLDKYKPKGEIIILDYK